MYKIQGKARNFLAFLTAVVMSLTFILGSIPVGAADTPGTVSELEQTLSHDKYVEDKLDGTYDLTLTIAGAVGSETSKAKLDVIYVLDRSGSMDRNMNSDKGWSGERRKAAGDAINGLTNALAGNENLDVRFSLAAFSGSEGDRDDHWDSDESYNDAEVIVGWTANAGAISNASKPGSDGGTNYQAGLMKAKELLTSRRDGAMTAVIFVSDGDPTFRYDSDGYTEGEGNSDSNGQNLNAAKTEVKSLEADYFFTVGVGPADNYGKLRELKDAAVLVNAANREFYEGTDKESLNAAFDDIQASITKLLCTNVTVTDVLSKNVQIVNDKNGVPKSLTVSVKDGSGKVVASGENQITFDQAVITARYDVNARKIIMDFPDDYELKEGYTYLVTANIEATEAAYEAYRANGNAYPDVGDKGTGEISAGKPGVFTNDVANVTYTYNGKKLDEKYAKPVIPLHPGTLRIEKKILGLDADAGALAALKEQLVFEYSLNDKTAETVSIKKFQFDEETKIFSYVIKGLSPNTTYKVSEKNGDLFPEHAYNLKTVSDNTEGKIEKDETETAVFQNQYSPSERLLTVEKQVKGNAGDENQRFAFHLSLKKEGVSYTEPLKFTTNNSGEEKALEAEKGIYTFYLKDDETITLKLPYGCTYRLEEENLDYEVEADGVDTNTVSGTLKEDKKITYTNTKNLIAPTGITTNYLPYMILVVSALVLALGFGGKYLRRCIAGRQMETDEDYE